MEISERFKDVSHQSFVGLYSIPDSICDSVVDAFRESSNKAHGSTFAGTDLKMKDSIDMPVQAHDRFLDERLKAFCVELDRCCEEYKKEFPATSYSNFTLDLDFNVQQYPPGGGYHSMHCERSTAHPVSVRRHLVWMTYLVDVEEGGGTRFPNQRLEFPCQKGLTLFWPADWTHIHQGIVAPNEEKIITTGWYLLK